MNSPKAPSRSSRPARIAVRGKSSSASPTRRAAPKAATASPAAKVTKEPATPKAWYATKKGKVAAVVGAAAVLAGVGTLVRKLRAAR